MQRSGQYFYFVGGHVLALLRYCSDGQYFYFVGGHVLALFQNTRTK